MICSKCSKPAHIDFPSGLSRCNGCERSFSWCRCAPVKVERRPRWMERSLLRDMTTAA